ncbi:hypothetical protein V2A60_010379 [Cordyceps javanica]
MDERQPKQEYTPSINTPTSAHAVRSSVGPSANSIYSAGSAAVTPKSTEVDSDAGITMAAATAEQTADADSVGSVSRSANSGKREDVELRRSTHRRRVPGILREPARRGLRMQTEEAAEVHGEEPLTNGQDPDSQQPQDLGTAASDRPAMAPSTPKLQNSAAIGKPAASQAGLFSWKLANLTSTPFSGTARVKLKHQASISLTFVRYYWREMIECVQAIHALAVVHSDLKPANFVLVGGRLKLIDFGIANAIQTDMTANVHRETMAGTVNYMSPESLMDSNQYALTSMHNANLYMPASGAPKIVKVGKPSDVWSLGCILYQMVYGMPPFAKIAEQRSRIRAIVDWSYRIKIPATTEDGSHVPVALIQTMRSCLSRDQKDRPTCEALLSEGNNFCYPKEYSRAPSVAGDGKTLLVTKEQLGAVIQSVVLRCKEGTSTDDKGMAAWPSAYWTSLRKAVAQPAP